MKTLQEYKKEILEAEQVIGRDNLVIICLITVGIKSIIEILLDIRDNKLNKD